VTSKCDLTIAIPLDSPATAALGANRYVAKYKK